MTMTAQPNFLDDAPPLEDEELIEEAPTSPTWPPAGRTGEWWMLWQEDRPNTPSIQLLGEAAAYFSRKYGVKPNHALVPSSHWEALLQDEQGKPTQVLPEFPEMRVRTTRTIRCGELWLSYSNHEIPKNDTEQNLLRGA